MPIVHGNQQECTSDSPAECIPGNPEARATRVSLKQWRMFHAVVDFDGFAEAAEHLHLSQSSISHALAKLQDQLGVPILTLKGRKSQVTEAGQQLLERSREVVRSALALEDLAARLREGWGPEIRLAIDPIYPSELLMHALRDISALSHKVRLSVEEAGADRSIQALQENAIDFAISTRVALGFRSAELIGIEHVPVAHPGNPLFSLRRQVGFDDLQTQTQVTVSAYNDYMFSGEQQVGLMSPKQWNVSSLERALATLRKGGTYAWLPKYMLRHCLDGEQLRILPLDGGASHTVRLFLIQGRSVTRSPSALRFADALRKVGTGGL